MACVVNFVVYFVLACALTNSAAGIKLRGSLSAEVREEFNSNHSIVHSVDANQSDVAHWQHYSNGLRRGLVLTLYHQTSPDIADLILQEGFKPGHIGLCGGAIYFATDPLVTTSKSISPDSHHGQILVARVDLGKMLMLGPKCDWTMTKEKLDARGYDSVVFNPINGNEYAIFDKRRILSVKKFHWR